jgi:adenylate cyclase
MIPDEYRGAFFAPEIARIHGELLLQSGKPDDAEQCLRGAIEIAARRAERSLELRAATSLARLLMRKGRRGKARQALSGIYEWFTEGFDTADLRAAQGLLDDLNGGLRAPPKPPNARTRPGGAGSGLVTG